MNADTDRLFLDSNILILYSENMQHNQLIGSLKIANSFESDNRLHDVIGGYHVVLAGVVSKTELV